MLCIHKLEMHKRLKKSFSKILILLGMVNIPLSYAEGPKLWIENEGGLSMNHITNGKVKVRPGFFGSFYLKDLVKDNPTALALTEKQSQFITYAHLSYWLGAFPSAVLVGVGISSKDDLMTYISLLTLLGTSLVTAHFISESHHYMYQAINVYNGVGTESKAEIPAQTSVSPFSLTQQKISSNSVSVSIPI